MAQCSAAQFQALQVVPMADQVANPVVEQMVEWELELALAQESQVLHQEELVLVQWLQCQMLGGTMLGEQCQQHLLKVQLTEHQWFLSEEQQAALLTGHRWLLVVHGLMVEQSVMWTLVTDQLVVHLPSVAWTELHQSSKQSELQALEWSWKWLAGQKEHMEDHRSIAHWCGINCGGLKAMSVQEVQQHSHGALSKCFQMQLWKAGHHGQLGLHGEMHHWQDLPCHLTGLQEQWTNCQLERQEHHPGI